MAPLGFGKYKDYELADVPEDYLLWLISDQKKKVKLYEDELKRREFAAEATMDMMEKLIKAGYRTLATKMHPDNGGSTKEFQELQATYERLNKGKAFTQKPAASKGPTWSDV